MVSWHVPVIAPSGPFRAGLGRRSWLKPAEVGNGCVGQGDQDPRDPQIEIRGSTCKTCSRLSTSGSCGRRSVVGAHGARARRWHTRPRSPIPQAVIPRDEGTPAAAASSFCTTAARNPPIPSPVMLSLTKACPAFAEGRPPTKPVARLHHPAQAHEPSKDLLPRQSPPPTGTGAQMGTDALPGRWFDSTQQVGVVPAERFARRCFGAASFGMTVLARGVHGDGANYVP